MHWKLSHKLHTATDRIILTSRVYNITTLHFDITHRRNKKKNPKKNNKQTKLCMWHKQTHAYSVKYVLNIETEFDIVVLVFDFYAICLLANDLPYFRFSLCYFEIPFIWYWYCLRSDNVFFLVKWKKERKTKTKIKKREREKIRYQLGL